ncbi:MAG: branched-chain amino acid ABC transporter permease [Spirochaetaceae bacterium]|nr:branched-chain amino acid ABC transporter permease [Spirochaetaceae bacterium]MDT8297547.1 branched-chain amino acid ABC transporter permease [Spirochaetaceae bacterium]
MKNILKEIKSSFLASLWLMFLTFPIMVLKVSTINGTVRWRWMNLLWVGVGSFLLSWVWRMSLDRKMRGRKQRHGDDSESENSGRKFVLRESLAKKNVRIPTLSVLALFVIVFPLLVSFYQVGIMTSALMFVILGLGLNIVIGYGGLLHIGYAAFYAVGAYSYGLMYMYWGLPFWLCLPLGAVSGLVFGLIIGFPVLRLRGDYLAIVTLAFGEIVRLLLENLSGFTKGPEGIAQIPRPGFFTKLSLQGATTYLYYIAIALVLFTIFIMKRLEDSRIGRALEAMREDDIAAQSMGIDLTKAKLTTFALSSFVAGLVGVILAGKTTYINPGSFTLMESVMILVAVVLGGTGSIPGVIFGALIVTLIPEYFRALADYRMFMFGVALVVMSIFRPQGIIPKIRKHYIVGGGDS